VSKKRTGSTLPRYQRAVRRAVKVFRGSMRRAGVWLNSPNMQIGGKTPIALLTDGQYDAVDAILDDLEKNPPASEDD